MNKLQKAFRVWNINRKCRWVRRAYKDDIFGKVKAVEAIRKCFNWTIGIKEATNIVESW